MKTYIAFDANGIFENKNSRDLKNYHHVMTWQRTYPSRFNFLNLHDIDFTSKHGGLIESTVRPYLSKKLEQADNLFLIVSQDTDVDSSLLNWQIMQAVNRHRLPIIVAYEGEQTITSETIQKNEHHLPTSLRKLMRQKAVKIAHIPFKSGKIECACKHYSSRTAAYPWTERTIY